MTFFGPDDRSAAEQGWAVAGGQPDSEGSSVGPGCSCSAAILGSMLVVLTAFVGIGLLWLNTPYYGSVGPGPAFIGFLLLCAAVPLGLVALGWWLLVMHGETTQIRPLALILTCLFLGGVVLNWAPWEAPRTYRTPEVVGVVVSEQRGGDGLQTVRLDDGQILRLHGFDGGTGDVGTAGEYAPLEGQGGVDVGVLVLAGENPTPWYVGAPGPYRDESCTAPDGGCYTLDGIGTVRRESVDMDLGVRLKRAAAFSDYGVVDYGFQGRVFLNHDGEVTGIFGGY